MSKWLEVRDPVPTEPPPQPWECVPRLRPDTARLLSAMRGRRRDLLAFYPRVPVAPPRWDHRHGAPVGALLLLWDRWDYASGQCPRCNGTAFATCWGGLLSSGSVSGVCTVCGVVVTRFIGGIGRVIQGIDSQLPGIGHRIGPATFPGGWHMKGPQTGLIAALQELGASGLPSPRSPEFR